MGDRPLESARNGGRYLDGGIFCGDHGLLLESQGTNIVHAFEPYMLAYDSTPGQIDTQYVAWRPWWYYKAPGGSWTGHNRDRWGWRYAVVTDRYSTPPTYYDFDGTPTPTANFPFNPREEFSIPPGITHFIVALELYWYPHRQAGWAYTVQQSRHQVGTPFTLSHVEEQNAWFGWDTTEYSCGLANLTF